jgi:NhaP-type Na+/H+ or K+/H+ antiporter
LLNDASSLIVFRFALTAVISGTFVFQEAATSFLWCCQWIPATRRCELKFA